MKMGRGVFAHLGPKGTLNFMIKWGEGVEGAKASKSREIISRLPSGAVNLKAMTQPMRGIRPLWIREPTVKYVMPDKFLKGTGKMGGWWGKYL